MTGRGIIGIPSAEHGRWSAFLGCLTQLRLPPGMSPQRDIIQARGHSPAENRNHIVTRALDEGADWIFFLDDDLTFRPDTLLHLLAREVDVVIALSYNRKSPFSPLWWAEPPDADTRRVTLMTHQAIPVGTGLVPLAGGTSGGMLVRTDVFRGVAGPWWTLGQYVRDQWHDDVWFCELARAAGFQIWGDPTVVCGHMTHMELWPVANEAGRFCTLLVQGQTAAAVIE